MIDLGGQQNHQIKGSYDYGCVEKEIQLDVLLEDVKMDSN